MALNAKRLWKAMLPAMLMAGAAFAQEDALSIDEIHWPQIDSYCTFLKKGQDFHFDDPDTWRFVAFTNLPREAEADPMERVFMRINGDLLELGLETLEKSKGGTEIRLYKSHDADPYAVTFEIEEGEQGSESTNYSGTIRVQRGEQEASVNFEGDCGV
ncbi:hypothetical protein SAMN05216176_104211 [Nitratireductor indicus]|nr:hypothetical protein SAMN05216176_104211 [Nitratireductor indicus]